MKPIFLILFICLIYLIFQGVRVNNLRLTSKQLVDQTVPYQHTPANPSKKVLILGDSLQAGVGASSPEKSLPGLLGADFPDWQIDNLAQSGDETIDAARKIKEQLTSSDKTEYDLAIVQVGANDIFHLTSLDNSLNQLEQTLQLTQTTADQVVYITSGSIGYAPLFPLPADWYFTSRSQKAIPEFIMVADSLNIPVVDNYRRREEDLFEQDPDKYYAADGFHLSNAGYQVWHERLLEKLSEIGFTD